jgi:hypothetical protein
VKQSPFIITQADNLVIIKYLPEMANEPFCLQYKSSGLKHLLGLEVKSYLHLLHLKALNIKHLYSLRS